MPAEGWHTGHGSDSNSFVVLAMSVGEEQVPCHLRVWCCLVAETLSTFMPLLPTPERVPKSTQGALLPLATPWTG